MKMGIQAWIDLGRWFGARRRHFLESITRGRGGKGRLNGRHTKRVFTAEGNTLVKKNEHARLVIGTKRPSGIKTLRILSGHGFSKWGGTLGGAESVAREGKKIPATAQLKGRTRERSRGKVNSNARSATIDTRRQQEVKKMMETHVVPIKNERAGVLGRSGEGASANVASLRAGQS